MALRVIVFLIALTLTACGGGSGMNFNDGNWSMCMTTDEDGKMISNLPFPTGGLPPGAGATIDGITTICTPIPAKE